LIENILSFQSLNAFFWLQPGEPAKIKHLAQIPKILKRRVSALCLQIHYAAWTVVTF
jgi:hypothetical protein